MMRGRKRHAWQMIRYMRDFSTQYICVHCSVCLAKTKKAHGWSRHYSDGLTVSRHAPLCQYKHAAHDWKESAEPWEVCAACGSHRLTVWVNNTCRVVYFRKTEKAKWANEYVLCELVKG